MKAQSERPQIVRSREAARILGVSPRTLSNWRWKGKGPRVVRLSARCVGYDIRDLIDYLESRKEGGDER